VPEKLLNTFRLASERPHTLGSFNAIHDHALVWSDDRVYPFTSTAVHQFLIRASGGAGINTNTPNSLLAVKGTLADAIFQVGGTGGDVHDLSSGRDFVLNAVGGQFFFRSIPSLNNLGSGYTDQLIIYPLGNATIEAPLAEAMKRLDRLENTLHK
jgi:hypothetical protein